MTDARLVLTTCGSETIARGMAQDLADQGLAASVSLTLVHTFFRFDGRTFDEEEVQLLIVTTLDRYPEVEARILQMHTYEIPDVLMIRVDAGNEAALGWIRHSTRSQLKRPLR